MKRLVILTAVASVLYADGANAQYNDQPACVMFEHVNFRGRSIEMEADDAVSFRGGQFWNDRVSSVFVRRGCTLVAYEHTGMRGNGSRSGAGPVSSEATGTTASRRRNAIATATDTGFQAAGCRFGSRAPIGCVSPPGPPMCLTKLLIDKPIGVCEQFPIQETKGELR